MNELIKLQVELIDKINHPYYERKIALNQEDVANILGVGSDTISMLYPLWVNETEKINDEWIIDEKN